MQRRGQLRCKSDNPSPVTAFGVFHGIRAAAMHSFGKESLSSLTVAIQGAGQVGYHLAKHLVQAGARVVMCDIDQEAVKRAIADLRVSAVSPDDIYEVECDIFAPCALGAILNQKTLPRLKCKIIAGAANNQLEDDKTAAPILQERGILYAPDYVINSGGLINVANELEGYNRERALQQAENIYQICMRVFETAAAQKIPTFRAADNLAQERVAQISHIKRTFAGYPGGQIRGVS